MLSSRVKVCIKFEIVFETELYGVALRCVLLFPLCFVPHL